MTNNLLGSIEAGGTKFVLVVADLDFNEVNRSIVATTTPKETLRKCVAFFKKNPISALSVGSFGPIVLNTSSANYGRILNTPKKNWQNTDIVGILKKSLNIPIYFTTDVNASAYGEYVVGQGKNIQSLVYFTIGTGIGGGAIQNGYFIGGTSHLEMGHSVVRLHPDDSYKGSCPFHQNGCFEGVASGLAIQGRTGKRGEELPRNDQVFKFISYYAAQLAFNAYVSLAPEKIIFGGSVLTEHEMTMIQHYFSMMNNNYISTPLNKLICLSNVPNNGSATLGNLSLAKHLLSHNLEHRYNK